MTVASVLFWLGIMFVFVVLNALFVAAEYALVKFRRSRVQELVDKGNRVARTVQRLQKEIGTTIAGTQLGITLASLALGWIGENSVHDGVKLLLGFIPGLAGVEPPQGIAFALAFLLLTMTHVILGEQVPKSLALRLPERVALILAAPLRLFCLITWPLIWTMNALASLVLKLLRIPKASSDEFAVHSADEFEILFEASRKAGELGKQETDLLKRVLDLKELTAKQVMVPRTKMDAIADKLSLPEVVAVASRTKHSKLPVFRENDDHIIGILNTRDLFDVWSAALRASTAGGSSGSKEFRLAAFLRQVHFVPESMPAGKLLEDMRAKKLQMVVVLDEFGGTAGLITIEDLLEQLVGEIWDEYDNPQLGIEPKGERRWQVNGELTLFEVNKSLGTDVGCSRNCTTIAGAVIEALGRQPVVGDTVDIDGYRFTVVEMTNNAISKLEMVHLVVPPAPGDPPPPQ